MSQSFSSCDSLSLKSRADFCDSLSQTLITKLQHPK
nr:MAG TPA: hypothetical protein [Caudoviricetes sp.]